ncbi:oxygen-independent coproporphyrinogen III oxidase [Histidinibacterium aquaticum]|uniref:Coproporphyrinogen-III oxidase n=1 Tax=Histidinibacterium aquaticum TaxID=2613962 RepID=A0A5J5GP34_9RHOB|nr:oxygen-independent coproporphyrinogen III oxidase [Histidinibacterium aquaticum]KAA9010089.1 oxygen-independent coproporphyrinogen III oxidase [Histidinibacterium aquaticum]
MTQIDTLRRLGLFEARVPRYTSYPTAPNFSAEFGPDFQAECLASVDPAEPISVYIHIPFCERLCWFCACHTQGTRTLTPVEHYVEALETEISRTAAALPSGTRMGRLHWGGGTPTILPPPLIRRLAQALKAAIPPAEEFDFSVEIDPTMVDAEKIAALAAEGMTRASIGIQDFDRTVQEAIGRLQSFDATRGCVEDLRANGIGSLNVDLVYGLPHQDAARLADTVDKVMQLEPDRAAIFGYAHVPWASKRQKLIDETALPGGVERYELAQLAAEMFNGAGFETIGIDHFARPEDALAEAARTGTLRRNFQGYTEDSCQVLVGLGASSISRFPEGYTQNAPATAAWHQRVAAGDHTAAKGYRMTPDDRLRARAIEEIMCRFALDPVDVSTEFGSDPNALAADCARVKARFGSAVVPIGSGFQIAPGYEPLTRLIASVFDAHMGQGGLFSRAS